MATDGGFKILKIAVDRKEMSRIYSQVRSPRNEINRI